MKKVICFVGGESLGNPGPSYIGVYITDETGVMIKEIGQTIGNAKDAFALYYAVMVGLQTLQSLYGESSTEMEIELVLDNELVKKQLNSELPIIEPGLVPMFIEIHNMKVASFPHLVLKLINKNDNKEVGKLLSDALDGKR